MTGAPNQDANAMHEVSTGTPQVFRKTAGPALREDSRAAAANARYCEETPGLAFPLQGDVQQAASANGYSYVQTLTRRWAQLAESELLDVYQIPDTQRTPYQRNHMQPQFAQWTFPAWSKSALTAKTCPDGVAWRTLSRRIARITQARGRAQHELLISVRRWRPPMLFLRSDSLPEDASHIRTAARMQRSFWRRCRLTDLAFVDVVPLRQAPSSTNPE